MAKKTSDTVMLVINHHQEQIKNLFDAIRERDQARIAGAVANLVMTFATGFSSVGMLTDSAVRALFMNEADRAIRAGLTALRVEEAIDTFVATIAREVGEVVARLVQLDRSAQRCDELQQPLAVAHFVERVRAEMECAPTPDAAIDIVKDRTQGHGDDYLFIIGFGHEDGRRLPNGGAISARVESWCWALSMHPRQPVLEGAEWPDNWKRLRPQFDRLVTAIDAGFSFVDYEWPRPSFGPDEQHPKLSYLSYVEAHDFVLGAGIYLPRPLRPHSRSSVHAHTRALRARRRRHPGRRGSARVGRSLADLADLAERAGSAGRLVDQERAPLVLGHA